jgi:hypothetical protein
MIRSGSSERSRASWMRDIGTPPRRIGAGSRAGIAGGPGIRRPYREIRGLPGAAELAGLRERGPDTTWPILVGIDGTASPNPPAGGPGLQAGEEGGAAGLSGAGGSAWSSGERQARRRRVAGGRNGPRAWGCCAVSLLGSRHGDDPRTNRPDTSGAGIPVLPGRGGCQGLVGPVAAGGRTIEVRGTAGTRMRPRVGRSRSKVTSKSRVTRAAASSTVSTRGRGPQGRRRAGRGRPPRR